MDKSVRKMEVICHNSECEYWKDFGECAKRNQYWITIGLGGMCDSFRRRKRIPDYFPLTKYSAGLGATCPEAEITVAYPDHTETITFGDLVELVKQHTRMESKVR